MTSKECSNCKKSKPTADFRTTTNREVNTCIHCRDVSKRWRNKNTQHIQEYRNENKARSKIYYEENSDIIRERQKQYKINNPNKVKETQTSYYVRNKEQIRLKQNTKRKEDKLKEK